MTPTVTFVCSICGEPSHMICVYCTKDACGNHLCERCHRCSDCCECEVRLEERLEGEHLIAEPVPEPAVEPLVMDAAAIEPDILVETAVIERIVVPEPPVEEETPAVEPELANEQIPAPEPEMPLPPPPPPPQPHPDLSKLFAPEDAPPRVFPTSHGPVPISNNPPEDSPEPEESSDDEQS